MPSAARTNHFLPAVEKEQQQRGEPDQTEQPGEIKFGTEEDTEDPGTT